MFDLLFYFRRDAQLLPLLVTSTNRDKISIEHTKIIFKGSVELTLRYPPLREWHT